MQQLKIGEHFKKTAAMKNLFKKTMLFAAAAMAFVSCENDTTDVNTLPGIDVTVNATVEGTKSHFGDYNATDKTYPTVWDGTEKWYVAINEVQDEVDHITYNDDNTSATVNMTVSGVEEASTYTLYAISPSSARVSYAAGTNYRISIPTEQTPKETSCDPAAQILIAQSEPQAEPTSFNVTFKHATAYAKFSFVNLNLEGAIVNNVTIESELPFANRFDYKFEDKSVTANSASSTITLTDVDVTKALWFACAPVDLQGKKLTFTINTDKGPLTRVVTMPADKGEFKSGVVAQFNINMEGIEFEKSVKYELVTNASELAVGDEIIIADKGTANQAISTTQNNNNRAGTAITKDGNYIVDPSNAVQIITLTEGTVSGTFGFKAGSQYLYAASSSSNYMKSQSTNNANGSWKVTIAADGTATIVAQGTNTANTIRYNPNNGTPIFSCYKSTSTTGTLVAIYKLPSNKPVIAAAGATAPIVGGEGQTATYTLKNIATDDIEVVSFDGNITEATKSANGTITYNISENTNKGAKVSNIVLSSPSTGATATISVTQAAPVFTVTPASLTFEATANSTAKFKVTSTYAATIKVNDATKWSVSPATVEDGAENVEITVTALTANEGEEAVTGTVTVTRTGSVSAEVSLSQDAAQQGGGDEPATKVWTLVTDASTLKAGDQIIIACNSKAVTASNTIVSGSNPYLDKITSTFSSDKTTITSVGSGTAILTLGGSAGAWTLTNESGKKLGTTAAKKVAWGSGTTTWAITISSNNATIQSTTSSYGRFLYNAQSPRFTTYTSNTTTLMLLPQIYRLQ